jgi:hypothetical protein
VRKGVKINMYCPYCGEELIEEDTFGNADYILNSIGYYPDYPVKREPIKGGDIYLCDNKKCSMYQENFYTLESEDNRHLHEGYPC